ncbi:50S ribosome-binding GTPase [Nocardioides sp. cx-169]|uniref:GTPase n=1 Tax=Nocardioides sp. cx-169 TaxID=2899080 RepID=UPI001E3E8C4E|nr:GTPase [Nocardioides sp. cx-169]MCD4534038.1 50S ribosome-binding GTPase [Nocardioides sp. cx-169]
MTTLLEGAKKLVTRGTDIGARITALEAAATAARGRLDDALVDEAEATAGRAAGRLRLSARHTVVGIAGATGSGKSSTFNALTGLELSAVGVRRPTTSWASACVWGSDGADELLEWLGIPPRHQTTRDSMLDTRREDSQLDGVVLLDLPDHDSTELSHHLEVDRLVQLVDMLVWVLDPQKYADAAIHDRYLKPLQSHASVMVVVLNHIDTVPEDRRPSMVADVRRLLDQDGLQQVPIIPVSARHGIGMAELRAEIAGRVADKQATRQRLEADLRDVAARLQEASGSGRPRSLSDKRVADLEDSLADAAGVPTVVDAVERSTRLRAGRATGWPVVAWFSRLKPDPLKRLHLDLGDSAAQLTGSSRTSLPATTPVQRARVDTEVRALADDASAGLGRPWVEAVRRASTSRLPDLNDRLDRAVGGTDLGVTTMPWWAGAVRGVQWALIATALVGGLWLAALAVMGYLQLSEPATPDVGPLALPTLLLVGGIALGLLLALVCRWLVAATARRKAHSADRRLRAAVHEVADELVVRPVAAELAAYSEVRTQLATALK